MTRKPIHGKTIPESSRRRACTLIPAAVAGQSVLEYLTGRFTYHTQDEWWERIRTGQILVDDRTPDPRDVLRGGETLEYCPTDLREPAVNRGFRIVFEDTSILVVDKPGDLPVHPGGRFFQNTLWALLRAAGYPHFEFVNRLDRETSGLVLLARTPQAARHCRRQLERHTMEKVYLAVVEGAFRGPVRAEGWITGGSSGAIRKKQRFFPAEAFDPERSIGKPPSVLTVFELVRQVGGLSLIEARPVTGRLHQIRATLEALGFPLVGDKLYGVDETLFLRFIEDKLTPVDRVRLRLPRQALHAAELTFQHPETGERLRLSAPLPADMRSLVGEKKAGL